MQLEEIKALEAASVLSLFTSLYFTGPFFFSFIEYFW